MLYGADLGPVMLKTRAHTRIAHHQRRRGNIDYWIKIRAPKNNTGIGRSGPKYEGDLDAGMQANPSGTYQGFECTLFEHVLE